MRTVFISASENLNEEKELITKALIRSGCVPVDLSSIETESENNFLEIARCIDMVDSCVFLIAGDYGRINLDTKHSYTEMAFNYAAAQNKQLRVFMRSPFDIIPPHKKDTDTKNIEQLREHIAKTVKPVLWQYKEDLEGYIYGRNNR